MRPVIMLNRISIDGFFAGPNGEIDWFIHDPEVDQAVHGGGRADTLLMGRVTYQMFEAYWPRVATDPHATEGARLTANELSQMTKIVFTRTLRRADWENTELAHGDLIELVRERKSEAGTPIMLFGSGTVVQQLANAGLIDEYYIIVTPVVLGKGKPLFHDVKRFPATLVAARSFHSGNVLLHYRFEKQRD